MDSMGPPQWLLDMLPEGARSFLESGGWFAVLGVAAVVVIALVWIVFKRLAGSGGSKNKQDTSDLFEELESIPAPSPNTGDRRLHVEGTPVRLRLVVFAPVSRSQVIDPNQMRQMLNQVVTGLGDIAVFDQPQVRLWPAQLSDQGFANTFHNNTAIREGEHEPSPWVLTAGRAHLGKEPIFLGLAMKASKPTTIGRRRLQMHDWANVLRIRTKD